MPREWGACLSRWSRLNAAHRRRVGEAWAPDRNDEYLFYQSLLGIWPNGATRASDELVSRLTASSLKAAREAKVHTSWLNQEEEYEQALTRFVERTLRGPSAARFVAAFLPLQQRIAALGMVSSLAQVVLKCVSPGVPDFYQGCEVWDFSLVDPDNRRPVDYVARRSLLASVEPLLAEPAAGMDRGAALQALLDDWHDGRIKLYVTAALLRLRRRLRPLFERGHYGALEVVGPAAEHALALARWEGERAVIAVVPRLCAALAGPDGSRPWRAAAWGSTRVLLPPPLRKHTYDDLFVGRRRVVSGEGWLDLGELFADFPVGVVSGTLQEGP
jgi:(1->4)-alpha-D-glucan 1-alpha-D-glucosylmutase